MGSSIQCGTYHSVQDCVAAHMAYAGMSQQTGMRCASKVCGSRHFIGREIRSYVSAGIARVQEYCRSACGMHVVHVAE
jgi:hypothetical protein